ncbi:MAG: hypothetical protein LBG61_02000 [Burkholderiales bacterium]|jgi:folate-binding protein YgfZ|nr:hypothetical protein [Burkholderiales bacterium]
MSSNSVNLLENIPNAAHLGDYSSECAAFDGSACLCAVGKVGVLSFTGEDAAVFLHNQFSTNIKGLKVGEGQHTTYNLPNGRMLATLFVGREPAKEEDKPPVFLSVLSYDLAETIQKRLSKYVLRSKVSIENVSDHFTAFGLCGAKTQELAGTLAGKSLNLHEVYCHEEDGAKTRAIGLSKSRVLFLVPDDRAPAFWNNGTRHARPAGKMLWERAAILDGIPAIMLATSEKLIPQETNWDILGGLDFQKGCYPGQEIIARMRYLGKLKTRLFLARLPDGGESESIFPGAPLYSPMFGEQSCGMVVNVAADENGYVMLVALQTAAQSGEVFLDLAKNHRGTLMVFAEKARKADCGSSPQ